ncbi:MAG: nucleotidyltransferase family protein [Cyanobacteria bacterium]|nr:nucleotidyltransferase family protein [Cyanobacteriota bacterium]MDW8202077.1 nucleotidyltransferase family protein [Cyanobacteriota bacterium SKYGB_h_bin112]
MATQCYSIILAAGLSTRMGRCKASLPWIGGKPLLIYQVEQLTQAGILPIVVLGTHNVSEWTQVLTTCTIVVNPYPHHGKTSSILLGLAALSGNVDSLFISAVDQPRPAWIYQTILDAHNAHGYASITVPVCRDRRGHPPLFSHCLLPNLTAIREDTLGLRQILHEFSAAVHTIEVNSTDIFLDLNTPETYHAEFLARS